jgi:hypothetical protein
MINARLKKDLKASLAKLDKAILSISQGSPVRDELMIARNEMHALLS